MDRRTFCCGCAGMLGALVTTKIWAQDTPWGAIDAGSPRVRLPEGRNEGGSQTPAHGQPRFQGCHLTAGQAGQGNASSIRFLSSCGIPYTDYAMQDEMRNYMIPTYGISPAFTFYDDSTSPNAFATPDLLLGNGEGTVAYGVSLIQTVVQNFAAISPTGGLQALGAIFAHEFGHLAQFKHYADGFQPGRHAELQADFVAGWYTGIRSFQQPATMNFPEMAKEMFNVGDFQFTAPDHHGTPQERTNAYVAGVQFSRTHGRTTVFAALDAFDKLAQG